MQYSQWIWVKTSCDSKKKFKGEGYIAVRVFASVNTELLQGKTGHSINPSSFWGFDAIVHFRCHTHCWKRTQNASNCQWNSWYPQLSHACSTIVTLWNCEQNKTRPLCYGIRMCHTLIYVAAVLTCLLHEIVTFWEYKNGNLPCDKNKKSVVQDNIMK